MASGSLLTSKYYDKLQVNRLQANEIKSDNILPTSPSYLYSLVLSNATFERGSNGGILSFDRFTEDYNIIQFSDRPFRKTKNITIEEFINLFKTSGINSFQEDPPNGVLVHDEEQRTYSIKLFENNLNELDVVKFHLELLPGENHNLNNITGRMSFFVDNGSDSTTTSPYIFPPNTISYIVNKNYYKFINLHLNTTYDYISYDVNDDSKNTLWIQTVSITETNSAIIPTNNKEQIMVQLIKGTGTNTNYTKCKYNNNHYYFQIEEQYQVNTKTNEILKGPQVN